MYVLDEGGARERETGAIPAPGAMTRYERNVALARLQDVRACLPEPNLEDVRGYYWRHGHLPDGRTVPDRSAAYQRAAEAMAARLRGDLPPADDE